MSELKLAESILGLVGGKSNVVNLVHCMTRLRFNLADEEKIKKLKGVMGVAKNGSQFQVIIGNKVSFVYKELIEILGDVNNDQQTEGGEKEKSSIISLILDNIAGIFTPMIFAISAVGMLKGIIAFILRKVFIY